jgi:hypothetical protein
MEEGVAMADREGATIKTKLKGAVDADDSGPTAGQQKRAEMAQFRLQVDRQTKASYATYAAAEEAALVIKRGHPIVRVTVFDAIAGVSTLIELPEQPSNS